MPIQWFLQPLFLASVLLWLTGASAYAQAVPAKTTALPAKTTAVLTKNTTVPANTSASQNTTSLNHANDPALINQLPVAPQPMGSVVPPPLVETLTNEANQPILPPAEGSPSAASTPTGTTSPLTAPVVSSAKTPIKARAVMVDIDSRQLDYDETNNVYIATGAVHVLVDGQKADLKADKVVYDRTQNLMTAEGHVIITKQGRQTFGQYAKFDLVRETAMILHPVSQVNGMRIKSQLSLNNSKYTELEKGQIIIPSDRKKLANNSPASGGDDIMGTINHLEEQVLASETLELPANRGAEGAGNAADPYDTSGSRFKLVADEINVTRREDGVDDIDLVNPTLRWGKYPVARFKTNKVAFNEFNKQLTYLGPDVGFDQALGGFYYGPGWDFRAPGNGIARFSPLLTLGSSVSGSGAKYRESGFGPGVGALLHYENEYAKFNVGYSSRARQAVALGQVRLLSDNTKLLFARNENYVNGFFGQERPQWIVQLADTRKLAEFKGFELDTHTSAGWAGDNFFPTNRENFFVAAKGPEPVSAGRIQLQAQLVNQKPLLTLGNIANVGFRAQMALSGYTTGDTYAIGRAGPNINLNLGSRVYSQAAYYLGAIGGESPFVFDTYFRGKQSLDLTNAVRVNQFLTLGLNQNLSLQKDNAQKALLVGNQVFALIGPPEVKLNLAFDLIRRRTFFGLNYYPGAKGNKNTTVDFQRLRMFEPQNYANPTLP
jgi:hypothetical protein